MSDIKIHIKDPEKVTIIKEILKMSGLKEESNNNFTKEENLKREKKINTERLSKKPSNKKSSKSN